MCRVCRIRRVRPRNWSGVCDVCFPEYERAQDALFAAKYRSRKKLARTLRILQGRPNG
jgi:hypothetical protein